MPFKSNELDPVNNCIMQALHIIRDLPADVPLQQMELRTRVYQHLSHAANEILNATFVRSMREVEAAERPKVKPNVEKKQQIIDAFQEALRKDLGI